MSYAGISPGDLLSAVGALVSLAVVILTYRTLFHPLAAFQGPFFSKFTDGYGGYYAAQRCLHLRTYHDHLKYGPVFRQAPSRLVFNTATALKDIYLNAGVNKAHIYKHTQFNPQVNIFGTLDRVRHRQKRKLYGQILSDRSLRAFEPTMNEEIDIFLKQLSKAEGKAVNMSSACERLATDIAGQLAFGQPLHTQVEEKNRIFPRAMVSMNAVVSLFTTWPLLGRLNRKNGAAFNEAIRGIIQSRMALSKDAKCDFYSVAADDVDTEEGLKRSELWAEAVFFLPAGEITLHGFFLHSAYHGELPHLPLSPEAQQAKPPMRNTQWYWDSIDKQFLACEGGTTISASLSAIFFYLSRHPPVYARLASEIRTTFTSGRDIKSGPELNGSKYLRAVIDESMRMSPPFLGTFWREPHESYHEAFVVDGHLIPPGTIVGVSPYCLMHNEAYFPEPFEFRPERWLDPEEGPSDTSVSVVQTKQRRSVMREAFAPFALGETGCLGKAMAYHEMSLVVAKSLWYFDFEKSDGDAGRIGEGKPGRKDGRGRKDEYQLFDLAVADHDGPNLVFCPRKDCWRKLGVMADEELSSNKLDIYQ